MPFLFRFLSHWPLWLLHGLGWLCGWLVFIASPTYRRRLLDNAKLAGIAGAQIRQSIGQAGRMVAELPRLWLGAAVPVQWRGAELVQAALDAGQGIVFLTPHLGCFEITAQGYAQRFGARGKPVTVLFRPPRQAWLHTLVASARQRPYLRAVPTNASGVRQLMRALKNGECLGMLPDQVPPQGQGLWTPFFGKNAYTMTLSARLATHDDVVLLLIWGERLAWGRGYCLHVQAFPSELPSDVEQATACINQAMEQLIRQAPQQYLWGYARYKEPRKEA